MKKDWKQYLPHRLSKQTSHPGAIRPAGKEPAQRDWGKYLPKRMIRAEAIRRVRKSLVQYGKSEHELSMEELEYLVADEETKLKSQLANAGTAAALFFFFGLR
ncbi:MAG: hypothetical protein ACR2PJ_04470 [Pseudomonadales bacterium]